MIGVIVFTICQWDGGTSKWQHMAKKWAGGVLEGQSTNSITSKKGKPRTFALITPVRPYSLMKPIDRTLTYVKLARKPFKPGIRMLAINDCG